MHERSSIWRYSVKKSFFETKAVSIYDYFLYKQLLHLKRKETTRKKYRLP